MFENAPAILADVPVVQAPSVRTTEMFWSWVNDAVVFGLIGIGLLILGYFLFDILCRRIDVQEQLNRGNVAVAIVVAALLLSIAYIATHAIH